VIAFDFQEALSFEGETGPLRAIRRGARAQHFPQARRARRTLPDFAAELSARSHGAPTGNPKILADAAGGFESRFGPGRAVSAGEPAHVAKYAFQLAQTFNNFYHQYPILQEPEHPKEGLPACG
jgi:arginyl-tRNA synthetase